MKKRVVKLSLLGILTSIYFIGLNASAQTARTDLTKFCCTSGNGKTCCGNAGCSAGPKGCDSVSVNF